MRILNRVLLIAGLLLFVDTLFSQININVQVMPPYQSRIAEYVSRPELILLTVSNTSQTAQRIQLTGSITSDNGVSVRVKPSYKSPRPIDLSPGQVMAMDASAISFLFNYSSIDIKGIPERNVVHDARLPEGTYQLCIRALDYDTGQPISPEEPMGCSTFFVNDLEPPFITAPHDGETINSVSVQTFPITWLTPPGAVPSTQYRVKIVEIVANRNPYDAMRSATTPPFFEKTVMGTNALLYGPADPALTQGRKYALMVQAIDPSGQSVFRNDGMSEVHEFTYNNTSPEQMELPVIKQTNLLAATGDEPDCGDCATGLPSGTPQNHLVEVGSKIKVGQFEMTVSSLQERGEQLTGEGTITITSLSPTARLRVQFANIHVNGNLQMTEGRVHGMVSGEAAGFMPTVTPPDNPTLGKFGPDEARQLTSYFQQHTSQLVSNIKQSASSVGFELPFGLSSGDNTLAITSVTFSPSQAWFSVAGSVNIPDSQQRYLALTGKNFCMNATDFCNIGRIYLSEDFAVHETFKLKKHGGDINSEPGTFIEFDKEGFRSLAIDGEYSFASTLERADNGTPLVVRLSAKTDKGWSDWITEVQMPDFRISGMRSITFKMGDKKAYYDHSDLKKPNGIPDSFSSPGESPINTADLTWHGFYIPTLQVQLPEIIKNGKNLLTVEGKNIIIDNSGLTCSIRNDGTILALGNGSLGGWYASVDKVGINIFKSGFKESVMGGKFVLPGTKDHTNASNQLDYKAMLTSKLGDGNKISYKFIVEEKDNIAFDVLFMTLNLDNCDLIVEGDLSSTPKANLTLSGRFSISNDPLSKVEVPGIKNIHLPDIRFNNLRLMTYGSFTDLSEFTASLSSPDKSLAGFEFTLNENAFNPVMKGADIVFPISGTLDFAAIPGLSFAGDASVSILGGFEMKENDRIGFKAPSARINEIKLGGGVDLGAFKLSGALKYYYDNRSQTNIREGFVGALETAIAGMLTLNMRAHFGTSSDQGGFKYFDFNAMADLGYAGINFMPPVPFALYGFGGGFAYNMKINESSVPEPNKIYETTSSLDPDPNSSAMELLDFNPSRIEMTPSKGTRVLQATILFGLTSRNTLDADATLSMAFNDRGGLSDVSLVANGRILTDVSKPLSQRESFSTGTGKLEFRYDVPAKIFTAGAKMVFGVPNVKNTALLKAEGTMSFYAGPAGWNFKFGDTNPDAVNNAGVEILGLIKGKSYFQIGSYDIDPMPEIPAKILELAGQDRGKLNINTTGQGVRGYTPGGSKSGMVVGAVSTLGNPDEEYRFLFFYGKLFMMTGFDFSVMQGQTCGGNSIGGPGGWYATGQAYMGAGAEIGIDVDIFLIKGRFEIFKAGAAAYITAGLPNPFYAKGAVGGSFRILNGAVKGQFSLPFSIGEKCVDPNTSVFAGLDIISQVQPQTQSDEEVEISTTLGAVFNLESSNKPFTVDDWDNVDKNGKPKVRIFRFDKSCIVAELNGRKIDNKLLVTTDNLAYIYNSPEYLNRNTTYTWKVSAKLKEASSFEGNFDYVKKVNSTEDAEQVMSSSFRTNKGFKNIPPEAYAYTTPLHSHKRILTGGPAAMEIVTKKPIGENQLAYPTGTTYVATLYRNGTRIGGDIPVTRSEFTAAFMQTKLNGTTSQSAGLRSRWSFQAPALQPNSDYEVVVVAKLPSQASQKVSTKETTNTHTGKYGDDTYLFSTTISRNLLDAPLMRQVNADTRPIVARFVFSTSQYATLTDKMDDMIILRIEDRAGKELISDNLTKAMNRKNFEGMVPLVNEKYAIRTGDGKGFNFPVNIVFGGESYGEADVDPVNSDKVFMVSSGGGSAGNIRIEALYRDLRLKNYESRLLDYIADMTGISRSQLSYQYTPVPAPANTSGQAYLVNIGVIDDFIGKTVQVGATVYPEVPPGNVGRQADETSSAYSKTSAQLYASSFVAQSKKLTKGLWLPVQFKTTFWPETVKTADIQHLQVGNTVQNMINEYRNPVINPVINSSSGSSALNAGNMGSVELWQSVSTISNRAAKDMRVSDGQLKQGVNNALGGGLMRY